MTGMDSQNFSQRFKSIEPPSSSSGYDNDSSKQTILLSNKFEDVSKLYEQDSFDNRRNSMPSSAKM